MFSNTSSPFAPKTSTPGAAGGFGQQPAFGNATTNAFGTPPQSTFQTPAAGFGQATSTPVFGQTPGFGQATGTPAFGTSAAQPSFGTPTTTPAFGATTPSFNSTPISFGGNQQKAGFGTTATTQAPLNFGAATTQAPLSFGTPTTQAPLSFGTATAQPAMTATTTQSGFSFGTNAGQTGFGTNAGQTGFGTASTATPSLATNTLTAQSSINFNPPQTTAGFNTPKELTFGTPSTTQSSLTFGTSLTTKSATTTASVPAGTSFGFSTGTMGSQVTAATTQNLSNGLGLSGLSYSSLSVGGKSMLTITGNTATPLYGTKSSDLNASKVQGQVPPKCQTVHPLVLEMVESFKNHIKEQKHLCLEVSRASLKPISKISNDAENVKKSVMKLERAVNKNKLLNSKLKEETIRALADVEIAQKAMDYPGGFPCDNSIITDYFLQLANKFQAQVVALRIELENTEKSIMCELNPAAFTPQELSTTMQRLYECFVALAGRFQFVHAQISNLKVQHLELRKKKLEDYTDIFSKKNFSMKATNEAASLSMGPSPFSAFRSYHSMNISSRPQHQADLNHSTLSVPAMAHSLLSNTLNKSALQNTNLLSSPASPFTSSAPGSKRGKR